MNKLLFLYLYLIIDIMKPKIFLRKLLRGGNGGIAEIFKIDNISIDDKIIENSYISNINLDTDEFSFNEAYINTYYLHLSIFCYYYIKSNKKTELDRVEFITKSVDKIRDYVKCFVLYKILEKIININDDTGYQNKLLEAIKSTDAFDDFNDDKIEFSDTDKNFDKMKKILSGIAIIVKYSGNGTVENLKNWCNNYDEIKDDRLKAINELLLEAQKVKANKIKEVSVMTTKSDILTEIKTEVNQRVESLKQELLQKYEQSNDDNKKKIDDAIIADIEDAAIKLIEVVEKNFKDKDKNDKIDAIVKATQPDKTGYKEKKDLIEKYNDLLPYLKEKLPDELKKFVSDSNNTEVVTNFYDHYHVKYLNIEELKKGGKRRGRKSKKKTGGSDIYDKFKKILTRLKNTILSDHENAESNSVVPIRKIDYNTEYKNINQYLLFLHHDSIYSLDLNKEKFAYDLSKIYDKFSHKVSTDCVDAKCKQDLQSGLLEMINKIEDYKPSHDDSEEDYKPKLKNFLIKLSEILKNIKNKKNPFRNFKNITEIVIDDKPFADFYNSYKNFFKNILEHIQKTKNIESILQESYKSEQFNKLMEFYNKLEEFINLFIDLEKYIIIKDEENVNIDIIDEFKEYISKLYDSVEKLLSLIDNTNIKNRVEILDSNDDDVNKQKGDFEKEKDENAKIQKLINSEDVGNEDDFIKNIRPMVKTYLFIKKIKNSNENMNIDIDIADIELLNSNFKSLAFNLLRVSKLAAKLNDINRNITIIANVPEDILKKSLGIIKESINNSANEYELDDIKKNKQKLEEYIRTIQEADDVVKLADALTSQKGGKKRFYMKGGINDEIEKISEQYSEINTRISELIKNFKELTDDTKKEIESYNQNTDSLNKNSQEFEEKEKKNREKFEVLNQELQSLTENKKSSISELKRIKEDLKVKLKDNKQTIETKRSDIIKLIEKAKEKLQEKEKLINKSIDDLKIKNKDLESNITALTEDMNRLKKENQDIQSDLTSKNEELENNKAKLSELNLKKEGINSDKETNEKELNEIEKTTQESIFFPQDINYDEESANLADSSDTEKELEEELDIKNDEFKEKIKELLTIVENLYSKKDNMESIKSEDFNNFNHKIVEITGEILDLYNKYSIGGEQEIDIRGANILDIKNLLRKMLENNNNDISIIEPDIQSLFVVPISNKNNFDSLNDAINFNESKINNLIDIIYTYKDNKKYLFSITVMVKAFRLYYYKIYNKYDNYIKQITDIAKKEELKNKFKNIKAQENKEKKNKEENQQAIFDQKQEAIKNRLKNRKIPEQPSNTDTEDQKMPYIVRMRTKIDEIKTYFVNFQTILDSAGFSDLKNKLNHTSINFNETQTEISKLLNTDIGDGKKYILRNIICLIRKDNLIKLSPFSGNVTTVYVIGNNDDDLRTMTLNITYNTYNLTFIVDDKDVLTYLKFNENIYLYVPINLRIKLKYEHKIRNSINLNDGNDNFKEYTKGGAANTENANNIFNTYIIMVLNKIMENDNNGLDSFMKNSMIFEA